MTVLKKCSTFMKGIVEFALGLCALVVLLFPPLAMMFLHVVFIWKLPFLALGVHTGLLIFALMVERQFNKQPWLKHKSPFTIVDENVWVRIAFKTIGISFILGFALVRNAFAEDSLKFQYKSFWRTVRSYYLGDESHIITR